MNTKTPLIILYSYATSPFGMKVKCYLDYKELPYKFVPVDPISKKQILFTKQPQIPVLQINEEWRKDSTPLGLWLDERFPEKPLLGDDDKDKKAILKVDDWISQVMIPSRFREAVDWQSAFVSCKNAWRLSRIVNHGTKLPFVLRCMWPLLLRKTAFIKDLAAMTDRQEPLPKMRERICQEFVEHLQGGDFLAAQKSPSLADLSAYPIFISGYLLGMEGDFPFLRYPEILNWMARLQMHLPSNPLLATNQFIQRKFPF